MKYIIKKNVDDEYIINKSKFIVCLRFINDIEDINFELQEIKNKYKGATHYCYAYILKGQEKCNDDKEPSGTAGLPILNVLKRKNIDNILCIVVRYFGGIKLGAGGLIRAYSNTVSETLNNTQIIEQINYKNIEISFGYNQIKDVEYLLKDCTILSKEFNDNIIYKIKIDQKLYNEFIKKLKSLNVKIIN